jgi:membrane protease subunit (stomatin/prohibitin family)
MFGGIQDFTKYQVASSIPLAAKNEGGIAGLGASIGAGVGIGQQFSQMLANVNSPAINDNSESMDGLNDEAISFLEKLHNLLTKGVITQQEFDVKKTEILKKLT